ncbi:DUF3376 domain-containing protein [Polaromonas sp. P1(28)-8]|nr:DUF3376 domain-containing protein [Polaromonas sp. P1(28)-8]
MPEHVHEYSELPSFGKIIGNFGVIYKKRRLNFVLHEINDLYQNISGDDSGATDPQSLDLLKIKIQKCIDELSVYDDMNFLSRQAVSMCRRLFVGRFAHEKLNIVSGAVDFLGKEDLDEISKLVERLGQECDMERTMDNTDAVLASPLLLRMAERCRVAILTGYLGYLYWDIILRPTASALSLDAGPIDEILIDRISPEDATTLALHDQKSVLQGGSFAGFGGFLSRSIRENDYLWGRLHAVDRLFDILESTVPANRRGDFDIAALKNVRSGGCLRRRPSGSGLSRSCWPNSGRPSHAFDPVPVRGRHRRWLSTVPVPSAGAGVRRRQDRVCPDETRLAVTHRLVHNYA